MDAKLVYEQAGVGSSEIGPPSPVDAPAFPSYIERIPFRDQSPMPFRFPISGAIAITAAQGVRHGRGIIVASTE